MPQLKNYREVGIFDLISAPLNPIGAFDAEQFKKDVLALLDEKKDEQFLAVDLTGLDFVYSDAYNAFIQFQQEMASRGGMFAVLSNNKVIVDGLKKAGLDKTIRVFAYEADMMSFSLHKDAPASAEEPVEMLAKATPVASQNNISHIEVPRTASLDRHTGNHRRFTKSFNAIVKDDKDKPKKGLDVPFDEEPSSAKTVVIVVLLALAAIGGTLAFFTF